MEGSIEPRCRRSAVAGLVKCTVRHIVHREVSRLFTSYHGQLTAELGVWGGLETFLRGHPLRFQGVKGSMLRLHGP